MVEVTIDEENGILEMHSVLSKKKQATLSFSKITDVRDITDTQIQEVGKSVIGRSLIGGLLAGPLEVLVGGMSGIGAKQKRTVKNFVVIAYTSNEEKHTIFLERVGASTGWQGFVALLSKDPPRLLLRK